MTAEQIYKAELERLMALFVEGEWRQLAGSVADILRDGQAADESD